MIRVGLRRKYATTSLLDVAEEDVFPGKTLSPKKQEYFQVATLFLFLFLPPPLRPPRRRSLLNPPTSIPNQYAPRSGFSTVRLPITFIILSVHLFTYTHTHTYVYVYSSFLFPISVFIIFGYYYFFEKYNNISQCLVNSRVFLKSVVAGSVID